MFVDVECVCAIHALWIYGTIEMKIFHRGELVSNGFIMYHQYIYLAQPMFAIRRLGVNQYKGCS